jgi:hypothetical protein
MNGGIFALPASAIQRPDRRLFVYLPTGNLANIFLKHCTAVANYESGEKLPLLLACANNMRLKGAPLVWKLLE